MLNIDNLCLRSLSNFKITEFFIILFISGKLNSRISMYSFESRFLIKKNKSAFPFAENAPQQLILWVYLALGTHTVHFLSPISFLLELLNKMFIHLKTLHRPNFYLCDILLQLIKIFAILDHFWVLLKEQSIGSHCPLIFYR